jgi:hypothetical protein
VRLRSFGCTGLAVLRAQALAQLTAIFPSVPPSAIADALGKAGGIVQQAADLLFKAAQARPACAVGTRRASPPRTHPGGRAGSVPRQPHEHAWAHARGRAHSGSRAERCGLRRAARFRIVHPMRRTHARQRAPPARLPHRTHQIVDGLGFPSQCGAYSRMDWRRRFHTDLPWGGG